MVTGRNTLERGCRGKPKHIPTQASTASEKSKLRIFGYQKFFIDFSTGGIVPMETADGKSANLKTESKEILL